MVARTRIFVLAAVAVLGGCETAGFGPSGPATPAAPRGASAPSGPIALGDYRGGVPDAVAQRFAGQIVGRYRAGDLLASAASDLQRNQFQCERPGPGPGDAPDRVCRRKIVEADCAYVWQAHLWADGQASKLTRVRGLFDKTCKADGGLLGGPG